MLLTTPLVRSLKARWPDAQIDMIVFRGTEGVLEHNPDIRRVITVAPRARPKERIADALRIWRKYDLACAAISSDRARFYAFFAGRRRIGLVDPGRLTRLTRFILNGIVLDEHRDVHTVTSNLSLADALDVPRCADVVAPGIGDDPAARARFDAKLYGTPALSRGEPYIVLHPYPMFRYKQWHEDGWVDLVRWARSSGFAVALSGGPAQAERDYAARIARAAGEPVLNMTGELSFGARGSSSARTPARRMLPPPAAFRRSRSSGRRIRRAGARGPRIGRPATSRGPCAVRGGAAMSICCRAKAIACRASSKAAIGIWTVGADA
ncbi:lipopolysaccharide core biosynthesis heptosyltransferase [Burkholderia pseudomallei]|nr:lipopolysaccharide core biosynthesis heptosyltransferase [Burkholderia pseudomallei]